MSPSRVSPLTKVRALTFDVFGTVVDWRSSIVEELSLRAHRKASSVLPENLGGRLSALTKDDWEKFAHEWHASYGRFCHTFDPEKDEWKDVDQHYRDSLVSLLDSWGLNGLYSESEIDSLSLVWHRLRPWDDSPSGLEKLGRKYATSTLSNGNISLLRDLLDFGGLEFQKLLSAETFHAYKPNPAVYLGAAEKLGVQPDEVAMVAAHLADLKAAKGCGLRTVYIERPREEEWAKDDERHQQAREWVDIWVAEDQDGFLELARKLEELA